jgi:hypothetical protein
VTWSLCTLGMAAAADLVAPRVAHAQAGEVMELMGEDVPPFVHSTGLYALRPAPGWRCMQLRDGAVECKTDNGPSVGVCTITYSTIAGQLDSELMAFNEERKLKKLKHFRKTGGGRLLLGDVKASLRSFTFDYQGNTEYPVAVEELYVVSGGKAIRVHFETMAHAMPSYGADLKQLYDTLGVAEVDDTGTVVQPAEPRSAQKKKRGRR